MKIFSLDISTVATGWSFYSEHRGFKYGVIRIDKKLSRASKLVIFRNELKKLLLEFQPTSVVIEDVYYGLNVKVLSLLSKFAGVAEECCTSLLEVEPYLISTTTVKSYFKVKKKEELFAFVRDLFELEDNFNYKEHNDIIDALAQLIVFSDLILKYKEYKFEKPYGFLYKVIER